MLRRGDTLVRENDDNYVKFSKLLEKAVTEGRVDGKYKCPVCGMRYNDSQRSYECCAKVAREL